MEKRREAERRRNGGRQRGGEGCNDGIGGFFFLVVIFLFVKILFLGKMSDLKRKMKRLLR
jgi:hypothetical protein